MYFEELKTGMTVDTAPAVIEKEKMVAFARDYDNIPLHTDEEYAKSTPFGKLIAPGVMSFMSVWAKYLEVDFFGEELLAGDITVQLFQQIPFLDGEHAHSRHSLIGSIVTRIDTEEGIQLYHVRHRQRLTEHIGLAARICHSHHRTTQDEPDLLANFPLPKDIIPRFVFLEMELHLVQNLRDVILPQSLKQGKLQQCVVHRKIHTTFHFTPQI